VVLAFDIAQEMLLDAAPRDLLELCAPRAVCAACRET
jgi:hypothetical protein